MLTQRMEQGDVAVVALSRPERRNALDLATVAELEQTAARLRAAPPAAVVVTGGAYIFSAGADLNDVLALDGAEAAAAYSARLQALVAAWEEVPCPTVAAIEGHCLGGGLEFALAMDLRVVGETARLGMPEIRLGLCPAAGGTQRLREAVGGGWARALVLGGNTVDAAAAVQIGLGTSLAPPAAALASALGRARELAGSAGAVLAFRTSQIAARPPSFAEGLAAERRQFAELIAAGTARPRIRAFLERRAAAGTSHT
jgi:enoyl-CoA hydratase/carnithine racemase